ARALRRVARPHRDRRAQPLRRRAHGPPPARCPGGLDPREPADPRHSRGRRRRRRRADPRRLRLPLVPRPPAGETAPAVVARALERHPMTSCTPPAGAGTVTTASRAEPARAPEEQSRWPTAPPPLASSPRPQPAPPRAAPPAVCRALAL